MNKTEAEYAGMLELRKRAGEIREYHFEAVKLRLGDAGRRLHYTPDFLVVSAAGRLESHEVKGGFVRDDARAKFEAARRMYGGFGWVMAQKANGEWNYR